jgi:hypothetical protein
MPNLDDLDDGWTKPMIYGALTNGPWPGQAFGNPPYRSTFDLDTWSFIVKAAEAQHRITYPGRCVECLLRSKGPHHHTVVGFVLEGKDHKCWFQLAFIDHLIEGTRPNGVVWGSWSLSERKGEMFVRLRIAADHQEPEEKIIVWKLTDQVDDRQGLRLGQWPD